MSKHRIPGPGRTADGARGSHTAQPGSAGKAPWIDALKASRSEAAPGAVDQGVRSPGEALEAGSRSVFEQRFGHDFGHVRIHAGPDAARSADALSADAYTAGSHIVFGPGRYQPETTRGRGLLAHELAHVTQQPRTASPAGGLALGRPGSVAERAAEAAAARVTAGLSPGAPVVAPAGTIHRTIKDDLNKAIAGWGTDEEAIYDRLAKATPDEKTAVLTDPVLMQDLYDDLTTGEWGKVLGLLGATAQSVNIASEGWGTDEEAIYDALKAGTSTTLKQQIKGSTMLMQLRDELNDDELAKAVAIIAQKYAADAGIGPQETYHLLVIFPDVCSKAMTRATALGVNVITGLIGTFPRGHLMPAAVVPDINTHIDNDNSLGRVQAAFEARWNFSSQATPGASGATPVWSVDLIRRLHHALGQLPAGHVVRGDQNVPGIQAGEISGFRLIEGTGGFWANPFIEVGASRSSVAGLTRHEVGHALDDFLGATTVGFKQNAVNGWSWSASSATWEGVMPNPWRRKDGSQVPAADQLAIKTVLDAYVQTDGSGGLRAGTPAGHAIRTYWTDEVPIIEAAKSLAGKKDKVYKDLGSVKKLGTRYFSWSTYYHEFYVYNAVVQDKRLTDYSLFGHPEFFAELYEAYYEEGTGPKRGDKLKGVPNWKQFFDNTVHSTVTT